MSKQERAADRCISGVKRGGFHLDSIAMCQIAFTQCGTALKTQSTCARLS